MSRMNHGFGRFAAAIVLCAAGASPVWAAFPDRPVKLVVPYTPGGSADQLARVLAERLSQELGQPVVVENKPGANTMIAATQVARAQPDGYTVFLASNASMVLNPMLYQKISYDAARDFRLLSVVAELPLVVVANNDVPAATLAQFVDYAQARPGKLNYASVGIGNPLQLATELLKSRTGIDVAHIPYNGSAPALSSLMGNDTQLMVDVISTSLPLVREENQGAGRDHDRAPAGAAGRAHRGRKRLSGFSRRDLVWPGRAQGHAVRRGRAPAGRRGGGDAAGGFPRPFPGAGSGDSGAAQPGRG